MYTPKYTHQISAIRLPSILQKALKSIIQCCGPQLRHEEGLSPPELTRSC